MAVTEIARGATKSGARGAGPLLPAGVFRGEDAARSRAGNDGRRHAQRQAEPPDYEDFKSEGAHMGPVEAVELIRQRVVSPLRSDEVATRSVESLAVV